MIHRIEDIEQMALETGFLPFFYCGIDGLSIDSYSLPRGFVDGGSVTLSNSIELILGTI